MQGHGNIDARQAKRQQAVEKEEHRSAKGTTTVEAEAEITRNGGAGKDIMIDLNGIDGARVDDEVLQVLAQQVGEIAAKEHGLIADDVQCRLW